MDINETKERTVEHNDKKVVLSKALLNKQNAWGKIHVLKALHKSKLVIEDLMRNTEGSSSLRSFDKCITELEFMLQEAWGFERNAHWHRFWDRPKCECPQMDNDDRYPTGYYIIAGNCPLHGE